MTQPMVLEGPRVILRPLAEVDRADFAAMNADPAVMRHFPKAMTREESDAFQDRLSAHIATHGWGFWAVEDRATGRLAGLCGLHHVLWEAHFTPAVEIGWRLIPAFQGRGLAEEAARLSLAACFGPLNLAEIVAFTIPANIPSWRLMERLGMQPDGRFTHPRWGVETLLYRLSRADWLAWAMG